MTREAGLECRTAVSLSIGELCEPPSSGRSVLGGVLYHELNIRRGAGHKRFGQDFLSRIGPHSSFENRSQRGVVLVRRGSAPGEPCDDRAVRKGCFSIAEGPHWGVVKRLGSQVCDRA